MVKNKINIGVIFCGYNQIDNIKQTLNFWNELNISKYNFFVSVISVPFAEYKNIPLKIDDSVDYIKNIKDVNICSKIFYPLYLKEFEARNKSLKVLLDLNVDLVWQVDSDEYYTEKNVIDILNFIESNKHFCYSVNFKNYIFDGKKYVDFNAPKINFVGPNKVLSFFDDNQLLYDNDKLFRPFNIPKDIAWVKHLTWLNETGKQKVEYQLKHFGHCSYKWNYEKNELEFDLNYYNKFSQNVPTVYEDI